MKISPYSRGGIVEEKGRYHLTSQVLLLLFCFGFINNYHFSFQLGKYIYSKNKNVLKKS